MKHSYTSLCLILITSFSFAFTIPNKPTAISRFLFTSEQQLHLCLGIDDKTIQAINFQKDDADAKAFMAQSLAVIRDSMKKHTEIPLLPIETLKDKITYTRMGYPLAGLKKAAKKGEQDQYVTIDILVRGVKNLTISNIDENEIEISTPTTEVDIEGVSAKKTLSEMEFYPQIQVIMKFADKNGKVIEKLTGEYTYPKPVTIETASSSLVIGEGTEIILDEEADAEQIPYYAFLGKAVMNLIQQL